MRAAVLVGGVVALVAAGCFGGAGEEDDPPRIVPWTEAGSARIGDKAARIRSVYGKPVATESLRLPVGTRYAGRAVKRESYRVEGGELTVTYVDEIARAIELDSPRYRTPDGIHVGKSLSRGPCRMNEYGSCEYRWESYFFDECGRAWVGYGETHQVEMFMDENLRERRRGRIAAIRFGDPHVVLHCF